MMLIFVLLSTLRLGLAVQVPRCCSSDQRLFYSTTGTPTCVNSNTDPRSLPEVRGLNLSSSLQRQELNLVLESAAGEPELPTCEEYQVHKLGLAAAVEDVEGWITSEGELVTTRYEAEFTHGQFCVEFGNSSDVIVAVMCNPCTAKKLPCISLCCAHGHAMVHGELEDQCQSHPAGAALSAETKQQVWDPDEMRMLNWERNRHYILEAPQQSSQSFSCPKNKKDSLVRLWAEQDQGKYRLQKDGSLQGLNLPDYASEDGSAVKNESWASGHFCIVVGSPPDYDYDGSGSEEEDELVETFMTCYDTEPYNWCTEFTNYFHPIAIIISILFLLMTLAAYAAEKSLREHLHGKMTVVFLGNLTICFIVVALSWFQVAEVDSGGCVLSGYLIQYFFLAFFFCLNAIAINTYLPFSMISATFQKVSETGRLVGFLIYAQGLPFLICAITAVIDATGPAPQSERLTRPNMGVYRCFLGAQYTQPTRSYFVQPDFIYFHSVIILLQVSNLVLLALTIAHLVRGPDGGGTKRENIKSNIWRFIKLFIILGFYWTGDILSTALALEYGQEGTCGIRIFADLTGLFSGVLLFLVLVCNRQVLSTLCRNRCSWLRSDRDMEPQELEETRVSD